MQAPEGMLGYKDLQICAYKQLGLATRSYASKSDHIPCGGQVTGGGGTKLWLLVLLGIYTGSGFRCPAAGGGPEGFSTSYS